MPHQGLGHRKCDHHKAELSKALKGKDRLRLAPTLLHARSISTLDIVLVVGKATWDAYACRAKQVQKPAHSVVYNARLAAGAWQDELVQRVRSSLFVRTALQVMGVLVLATAAPSFDGVEAAVLDFASCLVGTRALSGVQHSGCPNRFVLALADDPRTHMASFKKDWEAVLEAEAMALLNAEVATVVAALQWNTTVLPRLIFVFMERGNWLPDDTGVSYLLHGALHRIGDTLIIEHIHMGLRRLEKHSPNEIISRSKRMCHTSTAKVIESRGVPAVRISSDQVACAGAA
jgi:hypothetical protein